MNNTDKQYLEILKDILDNGIEKETRAGKVKSVFGRMMRFDLKEGLPLLTTKKVFTKGIIHELLWFLRGDTNIKYLIENNVHIWDDDAYRYYCQLIDEHNHLVLEQMAKNDEDARMPAWILNKSSKLEFIAKTLANIKIDIINDDTFFTCDNKEMSLSINALKEYTYGDLGDIYGKQWRSFGISQFDQIKNIINTLKTNPDDRRLLCVAFNPDAVSSKNGVALPPCHIMFQFYTRELNEEEQVNWLHQYIKKNKINEENIENVKVPKRELSCSFSMRSNDFCAGNPFNIASYAMLTYMIAEVCNMVPGELIYFGGDVHVYCNHIDQAREQLNRTGSEKLPILKFGRKIDSIDDFKYEDFIIEDYNPDPPIKFQLNVG